MNIFRKLFCIKCKHNADANMEIKLNIEKEDLGPKCTGSLGAFSDYKIPEEAFVPSIILLKAKFDSKDQYEDFDKFIDERKKKDDIIKKKFHYYKFENTNRDFVIDKIKRDLEFYYVDTLEDKYEYELKGNDIIITSKIEEDWEFDIVILLDSKTTYRVETMIGIHKLTASNQVILIEPFSRIDMDSFAYNANAHTIYKIYNGLQMDYIMKN